MNEPTVIHPAPGSVRGGRRRAALLALASVALLLVAAQALCSAPPCDPAPLDRALLELTVDLRNPPLAAAMQALTWLGSIFVLLPLTLACAGWQQRQGRAGAFVPAAVVGAWAIAHLVKWAIARPRPQGLDALVEIPADPSFPSSHAMQATAFALAWAIAPADALRWPRVVLGLSLATLVGFSRVYLQVHFPSDVVAGMLAATLWVLALRAWFCSGSAR